jgi:hypothetical protein
LALAGFGYVCWLAAQVWWYVRKGTPVSVYLNPQWFLLPVLGAGVSLVGWWHGRRRGMAACGIVLAAASVVTLLLLSGRWGYSVPAPRRSPPAPVNPSTP